MRLRHLGKLRNGAGFPVDLQGDPTQEIAFFKVKHLKTHGLGKSIVDTDDTVSEETAKALGATVFPPGTIVFAKIGAALLLARVSMIGRAACIDNNMAAFIPNVRLVDPRYILPTLSQIDMTAMVQPGAVPSLSTEAFYSHAIPVPDLPTQKAIADFLDRETARIDQLIEKKRRMVEVLGEKERAVISEGFAALGAEKWRVRHLGRLRNGVGFPVDLQGDPTQEIAFFKVKHLRTHGLDAYIVDTDDTVSKATAKALQATVFPPRTIVFAKIGAALLLGRFSMIGRAACLDNNMAAFIPNERLMNPSYTMLALSQIDMTTMVQPGAVPSLSTEAFYNYMVQLPQKVVQVSFVNDVRSRRTTIGKTIAKAAASIDRLREFRSALITASVTGEIDVSTWGKQRTIDRRLDQIEEAASA